MDADACPHKLVKFEWNRPVNVETANILSKFYLILTIYRNGHFDLSVSRFMVIRVRQVQIW